MKQFFKIWNAYSKYEKAKVAFLGLLCAIFFYTMTVVFLLM